MIWCSRPDFELMIIISTWRKSQALRRKLNLATQSKSENSILEILNPQTTFTFKKQPITKQSSLVPPKKLWVISGLFCLKILGIYSFRRKTLRHQVSWLFLSVFRLILCIVFLLRLPSFKIFSLPYSFLLNYITCRYN